MSNKRRACGGGQEARTTLCFLSACAQCLHILNTILFPPFPSSSNPPSLLPAPVARPVGRLPPLPTQTRNAHTQTCRNAGAADAALPALVLRLRRLLAHVAAVLDRTLEVGMIPASRRFSRLI